MNQPDITLGVCGTFGSPNGFQQCFYQTTPFSRSLDLDSKALEVFGGAPLFAIRRDGESHTVALVAYSYAREPQSSRRGTFIGSAMVLPAGHYRATALAEALLEMHSDVVKEPQNLRENVLQVSEATGLTVAEPRALQKAQASLQKGRGHSTQVAAGQVAFIVGRESHFAQFLEWGLYYFPHFDTLYFTANADTAQSASQKGLVPVLEWEAFMEEKEAVVAAEKAASVEKEQSAATRKTGLPAKEKKSRPAAENALFEPWEKGAQWSRTQREQRIEEHNNLLHLYQSMAGQYEELVAGKQSVKALKRTSGRRFNIYKLLFWGLALLVAGMGGYGLFSHYRQLGREGEVAAVAAQKEATDQQPLDPAPSANLDSASRAALFPGGVRGLAADSITAVLYAHAQTGIGETWPGMQARYRNALVAANEDCFAGNGSAYWCLCDSLNMVPVMQ